MKKFIKRALLGSSLALVTMAPVIAAVTETATLNVTSNVQQTIAICIKDRSQNVMASGITGLDTPGTLNFGQVDGYGYRVGSLVGSRVGVNTSGVPENPGTGSSSIASALYIYGGDSTTASGITVFTRIQGSGSPSAILTVTQPNVATDEQKVYLSKFDANWAVGGGWTAGDANHAALSATPIQIAGPAAFTGWGAVTDAVPIDLDIALRVYPSNTTGIHGTQTKFFATGY
jgi:hypothetical protein